MNARKSLLWLAAALLATLCSAPAARAQDCEFGLFGSGVLLPGGPAAATSNVADLDPFNNFGGAFFVPEPGTLFGELADVSVEFNLTDDLGAGGSPRLALGIDLNSDGFIDGFVFIALGDPFDPGPDPFGWRSTGNLFQPGAPAPRFFLEQVGGLPFQTYDQAFALLANAEVLEVDFIVDGGAGEPDGEQTVLFRNFRIDQCVFAPFSPLAPKMEVRPTEVRFGTVSVRPGRFRAEKSIVIFNRGPGVLQVNVEGIAHDTRGNPCPEFTVLTGPGGVPVGPGGLDLTIPPGQLRVVTVRFQPTRGGFRSCFIRVAGNDPALPFVDVNVNGTGLQ
jgi:hypothetical protein